MNNKTSTFIVLISLACAVTLLFDRQVVQAEGSGGSGGDVGELHDTWDPSEYYLFVPTTYNPDVPIRLFVVLHGDEGDPARSILWWWPPLWEARRDFIMLVPRAPYSGGSWWRDVENHDVWLTSLVDHLLGLYNIELTRMHLYGHSGGATFLGIYAVAHQDRFASVGCCIGGNPAYYYLSSPPTVCRIPARLVTGTEDFLLDIVQSMADDYESHGHEVELIIQPGVGHDLTEECLGPMMTWLFDRILCTSPDPLDESVPDAATDADVDVDVVTDMTIDTVEDILADVPDETGTDTTAPDGIGSDAEQEDDGNLPFSGEMRGECACLMVF